MWQDYIVQYRHASVVLSPRRVEMQRLFLKINSGVSLLARRSHDNTLSLGSYVSTPAYLDYMSTNRNSWCCLYSNTVLVCARVTLCHCNNKMISVFCWYESLIWFAGNMYPMPCASKPRRTGAQFLSFVLIHVLVGRRCSSTDAAFTLINDLAVYPKALFIGSEHTRERSTEIAAADGGARVAKEDNSEALLRHHTCAKMLYSTHLSSPTECVLC